MSDRWEGRKAPDRVGADFPEQVTSRGPKDDDNAMKRTDVDAVVELVEVKLIDGKTMAQWQEYWTKQMQSAEKRLRKFRKQGSKVIDHYLDDHDPDSTDKQRSFKLNLFHSNITTMESMLYGQTPKVDVSREHQDPTDDPARVAATMLQRMLQADVDPMGEGADEALREALQDRLLPGLGACRVRYAYQSEEVPAINPQTMEVEMIEQVTDEEAITEYVHWQDMTWGWSRTWSELPWLAFKNHMEKSEAEERFGEEMAAKLNYESEQPGDKSGQDSRKDEESVTKKAIVHEIWDKDRRKVWWYSPSCGEILDCKDDPLQLTHFWPIPRPMMANCTTRLLVPKADFVLAQDLYQQVNELATRISIITDAIKVVGVYDKAAGNSVGRMLKEGHENDLIPVDNWAMFAEKGGLKGTIDWFPVQDVVGVLQTLRQVMEDTIGQLHEVTGMADIMRGASQQYTGVGQDQLKAKFASVRVQRLQDEFARFASDLEALKAEVIAKHFNDDTIIQQSGAQFLPSPDQMMIPSALKLIRDPMARWRINIRPESIAMIDYAQLKAERTEFLNAMATYIQSAQAMVQQVPGSLPILMEMMKWAMSGFKGANYLEGIMDQAIDQAIQASQQQQPEQPSPEQMKVESEKIRQQTEQMKIQGAIQKIQAKAQADLQTTQAKLAAEVQKIQTDAQRDLALEDRQSQYALLEIAEELAAQMREIEANLQSTLAIENAQAVADMQVDNNQHQLRMREIAANRSVI